MKIKLSLLLFLVSNACLAEFPLLSENFESGMSPSFKEHVQIDTSRAKIEEIDMGKGKSKALVLDYSDLTEGFPYMLRVPKGNGFLPVGKNSYKISFDYKILSLSNPDLARHVFQGAIQRFNNSRRISDQLVGFNGKAGKTGRFEAYTVPSSLAGNDAFFYFSPIQSGAKIAIDNFKIERGIDFPAWMFEEKILFGMAFYPYASGFFLQNPQLKKLSKEEFFPFIDKFGQFKHKEWPNKVYSVEELKNKTKEEEAYNKKYANIPNRDKYMGFANPKYRFGATGRFRTQKVNGKWFLITPEGNLFWSIAVCTVGLYSATPITKREHYFEDISDKRFISHSNNTRHLFKFPHETFGFEYRNLEWKYGANWRDFYGKIVGNRLRVWGVNTLGSWSRDFILRDAKVPYTAYLDSIITKRIKSKHKLESHWQDVPDYFAADFKENLNKVVKKDKELIASPYCIGVFIDNELPWQSKELELARGVVQSEKDQPAKIKFMELLKAKYGEISNLNKAWKANYADWNDFLKTDTFIPSTKSGIDDLLKIEELYYRQYFKTCMEAVKSVSHDLLYLGCRFAWSNGLLRRVANEYVDVVSYNWYNDDASGLANPEGSVDKPIIISEYHFGNQDRGVFGGGMRPCNTMRDRIAANNRYVKTALENPNVVGVQWFRYSDQITSGRDGDGENASVGMVDVCDTPVYDFVESIRKLSEGMYDYRLNANVK